jgi:hypothetical protein
MALARTLRILGLVLMAGTVAGWAQTPNVGASDSAVGLVASDLGTDGQASRQVISGGGIANVSEEGTAAGMRKKEGFEIGPFVNGGVGLGNRSDYGFFSAGVEGGKIMTPVIGHGFLAGQFEYGANIMPLWLGFTPPQTDSATFIGPGGVPFTGKEGGGTYVGVSITPVIFRWNFLSHNKHFQPWFQAAGGLIYTTHKYPPDQLVPHNTVGGSGTSVWNFTPQGGGGIRWFLRQGRSIDLGVNGIHISSASLGDRNPGVNASIQVQIGYTFWR